MTVNIPYISIIIPAYNAEKYIDICLQSVLSQSLKNIEIIIIDDGSTDNTLNLIRKYAENDNRIKIFIQENRGSGPARNLGIKKSVGQFIAFMDADDFYPTSNILEILYHEAISNSVDICGGSFSYFENSSQLNSFTGVYKKYTFTKKEIINFSDYQFDYGYHRFLYSSKLIFKNKIFFPDFRRFQDPPFFVEAMLKAHRFLALPLITYCYRVRTADHKLHWTSTKVKDLVLGLTAQIETAKNNNLIELHNLNVNRINNDFSKIIQTFLEESLPQNWNLVFKLNNSIDTKMLVMGDDLINPFLPYFIKPIREACASQILRERELSSLNGSYIKRVTRAIVPNRAKPFLKAIVHRIPQGLKNPLKRLLRWK